MINHRSSTIGFKYVWLPLYIFLQLTWGFFQTLAGFSLFLFYFRSPHDFYHGSIRTKWSSFNGISLGLFIFTPNEDNELLLKRRQNDRQQLEKHCNRMSVHEYGHTYQSLLLGPFYLIIIGMISWGWARMKRYRNLRKQFGVPYSFCWTETWANALGEWVLNEPSIRY